MILIFLFLLFPGQGRQGRQQGSTEAAPPPTHAPASLTSPSTAGHLTTLGYLSPILPYYI